jgi:hypothetical protein
VIKSKKESRGAKELAKKDSRQILRKKKGYLVINVALPKLFK